MVEHTRTPRTLTMAMVIGFNALHRILQPLIRMIRQMSIKLKIKAKSLATEARHIRLEEIKLRDWHRKAKRKGSAPKREALYLHRVNVVRPEARATHLARAFLRNMPYDRVETKGTRTAPPLSDAASMVQRYGGTAHSEANKSEVLNAMIAWQAGDWPVAQAAE